MKNNTFSLLKPSGSIQACKNHQSANNKASLKAPPGYLSLNNFLKENRDLKMSDLLSICYLLNEQIKQVHSSGYAIGKINFHTVFVTNKVSSIRSRCRVAELNFTCSHLNLFTQIKTDEIQVYLPDFYAFRVPNTPDNDDSFSTDMEEFGILVKKMLQIYHSRLKYSYSFDYNESRKQSSKHERPNSEQSSQLADEEKAITETDFNQNQTNHDRNDLDDDHVQHVPANGYENTNENGYHNDDKLLNVNSKLKNSINNQHDSAEQIANNED